MHDSEALKETASLSELTSPVKTFLIRMEKVPVQDEGMSIDKRSRDTTPTEKSSLPERELT